MDQKAVISMLVVGAVAGWLASFLIGWSRWGLLGAIISGIVGSFVGGPLAVGDRHQSRHQE